MRFGRRVIWLCTCVSICLFFISLDYFDMSAEMVLNIIVSVRIGKSRWRWFTNNYALSPEIHNEINLPRHKESLSEMISRNTKKINRPNNSNLYNNRQFTIYWLSNALMRLIQLYQYSLYKTLKNPLKTDKV